MKHRSILCLRSSAVLLAVALVAAALFPSQPLEAQAASKKVSLMADTLRARDAGNLQEAKQKAEELIQLAPNDENVQRLLASINNELDRRASAGGAADTASVYGQAPDVDVEEAMEMGDDVKTPESESPIQVAAAEQQKRIEAAQTAVDEAVQLAELGAFGEANTLLDSAAASLTLNTATAGTLEAIEKAQAKLILMEARTLAESGDLEQAEALIQQYREAGGKKKAAKKLEASVNQEITNPYKLDISEISPEYVAQQKVIRDLLVRGRAQYLNGDYDGAQATFKEVEARDSNNSEAKMFQARIAQLLGAIHQQNHYKTRQQMLTEVDQGWERPKVFDVNTIEEEDNRDEGLQKKLEDIVIPQVNFSGMELTRVIETLSELSTVYDPAGVGLNIVPLFNPNETNPRVNISLRNLNLDRILQFVTQQVKFSYDVGSDAVTIQPSTEVGPGTNVITEFFPLERATVIKLTGNVGGGGTTTVDPFAPPSSGGGGSGGNQQTEALQNFFQSAGVNFELPGTSLAFDGETLIVTQTRRNLERMGKILRNYSDINQIEIEAKFLEVAQGDLDELGFNWTFNRYRTSNESILTGQVEDLTQVVTPRIGTDGAGNPIFGEPVEQSLYRTNGGRFTTDPTDPGVQGIATTQRVVGGVPGVENRISEGRATMGGRTLDGAFGGGAATARATITGPEGDQSFDFSAPSLPRALDLASGASQFFGYQGWNIASGLDLDVAINALARQTSSDLMSAPKVTVLSGSEATISVAQILRYPESYGDIETSATGGGNNNNNNNNNNSNSSAISITAGTPQDFTEERIGVEMNVKPTVGKGDTISMELTPTVTEFEGFVEYGGPSVAITSTGTTAVVPAGFYQPVFSERSITTEVTVFDGATLVMGGLTRDEVKSFKDKVPFLGDIPGVGRLFRSEGETRQKRNLLIFVTANLVSPGGSPARQNYRNVNANALFQNPAIMTPSGTTNRSIAPENVE